MGRSSSRDIHSDRPPESGWRPDPGTTTSTGATPTWPLIPGYHPGPASADARCRCGGDRGWTMDDVTWAGKSVCPSCKRMVSHKPQGGPHRWHGCHLRWAARRIAHARSEGWDGGYRFALDNVSDPMVYADLNEYGTGWAGLIEQGGLVLRADGNADDN